MRLYCFWELYPCIDNRPGGATNVGTEIVAKALADGHAVLLNNSSLVTKLIRSANIRPE